MRSNGRHRPRCKAVALPQRLRKDMAQKPLPPGQQPISRAATSLVRLEMQTEVTIAKTGRAALLTQTAISRPMLLITALRLTPPLMTILGAIARPCDATAANTLPAVVPRPPIHIRQATAPAAGPALQVHVSRAQSLLASVADKIEGTLVFNVATAASAALRLVASMRLTCAPLVGAFSVVGIGQEGTSPPVYVDRPIAEVNELQARRPTDGHPR